MATTALQVLEQQKEIFWTSYREFYDGVKIITIAGKKVDIHELFVEVRRRGGYAHGRTDKFLWWEVAKEWVAEGAEGTASLLFRQAYRLYLAEFEEGMMAATADEVTRPDRNLRARRPTRASAPGPNSPSPALPAVPPSEPPTTSVSAAPPSTTPSSTAPVSASATTSSSNVQRDMAQQPVPVIVLDTPSNRRGVFSQHSQDPSTLPPNVEPFLLSMIPEKTPRIYLHCVMGLKSGIPREVDFALHHLVVISDERGDKFRFSDFPEFAEALIERILEISPLTHGITWELDYDLPDPRYPMPTNTLNCAIGTFDLLDRLAKLNYIFPSDGLETREEVNALRLITEASLVVRNMVMLVENAKWLEDIEMVRDCATIILNLPNDGRFMEVKNNMLEVVEQCCLYWEIWDSDPLYDTLVKLTFSNDRFRILTALRSLNMFSLEVNREGKKLVNIPFDVIDNVMKLYLLDNDPELLSATLDFLYQYTLVPENVKALRKHVHLPTTMIRTMFNYLVYESDEHFNVEIDYPAQRVPASQKIHTPPPDVYLQLMQLNEPERTARWLKCCFVEDAECEITQLALWQAYQNVFSQMRAPGMHTFATLQATDFISTVTSTFPSAAAKIVEGRSAKFIIKGIRPLEAFYTLEGFPVYYCEWGKGSEHPCTAPHFIDPKKLKEHVLLMHLEFHYNPESAQWRPDTSRYPAIICAWDECRKFRQPTEHSVIADHVLEEHLPEEYPMTKPPPIPERPILWPALSRTFQFFPTPVDENGEPCGVAYKALLILRNIQRNLPAGSAGAKYGNVSWTRALFLSVRRELLVLADQNPSLRSEVLELVAAIDRS